MAQAIERKLREFASTLDPARVYSRSEIQTEMMRAWGYLSNATSNNYIRFLVSADVLLLDDGGRFQIAEPSDNHRERVTAGEFVPAGERRKQGSSGS